jgi:hypothetical protein
MNDPQKAVKEAVLGDALGAGTYAMAAIGMGFLAIVFSFLTVFAIVIGLIVVLIGWKYIKGGTNKMFAYLAGAVMIASGIAGSLFGSATTAGTTSAQLQSMGGVWKLFGYSLVPLDYIQQAIWNKPATTSWIVFKGISTSGTAAPSGGGAI